VNCVCQGNDQIRFELTCYALHPEIQVIAPWRNKTFLDRFSGRQDLLQYAAEHNIPVKATKAQPWSIDDNMMHIR